MSRKVRSITVLAASIVLLGAAYVGSAHQEKGNREELLKVRESVWRAWFANDTKTLEQLVPLDTIVISSDEREFQNQASIFKAAADFHAAGGKLVRLEFPRTEIQWFGDVAITYSRYLYETEVNGKRSQAAGRATEVFVRRSGKWTNPGWHTDLVK